MKTVTTRVATIATIGLVAVLGLAPAADAGAPGCGQVVLASITLAANIGPCTGDGLIAGADNITINLNGKRIFGDGNPNNAEQAGVRLIGRSKVTVRNGTVDHFNAGVFAEASNQLTIQQITATDNTGPVEIDLRDGILLSGTSNSTIAGNITMRNAAATGAIGGGGISLINESNDNVISRNRATDNLNAGIRVDAFGGRNTVIASNQILRNAGPGVTLSFDAANALVVSNTIQLNSAFGITISFGVLNFVAQSNTITGNGNNGINIGESGSKVIGNTVTGNVGNGIRLQGGQVFLSEGVVEDFTRRHNLVQSNTVLNNSRNGIIVECGSDGVSLVLPPAGTRGTCLVAGNVYGVNPSQFDQILTNRTAGNGGPNAGVITRNASGVVTGTFDILDQHENPPCDANTFSGNTSVTRFPACAGA